MSKLKVSFKLILLLVLPAALLDAVNGIYNVYVPIYLQAGGAGFDKGSATLTLGFGLGAGLVGLWMVADNILAFLMQPIFGAWSDRTRSRLGRRIPFILFPLPLVVIGFAIIPLAPTLIPAALSGQLSRLVFLFVLFTLSCFIYYLGLTPQRMALQTLRQEMVEVKDRPKMEAWYSFLMYLISIVAFTAGSSLYKIYGPLLFWVGLGIYLVSVLALLLFFREPKELAQAAPAQESTNWKQLTKIFTSDSPQGSRDLKLFLVSLVFFTIAGSALNNFAISWMVKVLQVSEARASTLASIYTIAAMVASLPAGFLAARRLGRKWVYIGGATICLSSTLLLVLAPQIYIIGLALFGLGLGASISTQLPLATELSHGQSNMGSVVGVFNVAYMGGYLIGAPLIGLIIEWAGYPALFSSAAVFLLISVSVAMFINPPQPAPAVHPTAAD